MGDGGDVPGCAAAKSLWAGLFRARFPSKRPREDFIFHFTSVVRVIATAEQLGWVTRLSQLQDLSVGNIIGSHHKWSLVVFPSWYGGRLIRFISHFEPELRASLRSQVGSCAMPSGLCCSRHSSTNPSPPHVPFTNIDRPGGIYPR